MTKTPLKTRFWQFLALLICFFILLFLLWNIFFGIWMGFILLLPFYLCIQAIRSCRWASFGKIVGYSVLAYLLLLPLSLWQFDAKSRTMMAAIQRGEKLDVIDKCAIYGMNVIMGITAMPLYPEVAIETLLMCIPDEDGIRTFNDDFFLASSSIQKVPVPARRKEVSWHPDVYAQMSAESRVALALNKCYVTTIRKDSIIQYEVEVEISYPPKARVLLTPWPFPIIVEEGLIRYLETCGWLFPYTAIWKTEVPATEGK